MITGIHHVAISTGDIERSLGFYRDLLGMRLLCDEQFEGELYDRITALKEARGRVALLGLGNMHIELFEFSSPVPEKSDPLRPVCDHGITHICFSVTDIHQIYKRLKAAGIHLNSGPLDFGEATALYGRDPDGNVFELIESR